MTIWDFWTSGAKLKQKRTYWTESKRKDSPGLATCPGWTTADYQQENWTTTYRESEIEEEFQKWIDNIKEDVRDLD